MFRFLILKKVRHEEKKDYRIYSQFDEIKTGDRSLVEASMFNQAINREIFFKMQKL